MSDITKKKSESDASGALLDYFIDAVVTNSSFKELVGKNPHVERQIDELKDHLSTIKKSKLILEEKILFQEQDIRKYKEKMKDLIKNIEKLNTDNINLKSENINLKSENENLKKAISELENKYEILIAELRTQNDVNEKCLILREVGLQTEKVICQIVFGEYARCRTLKTLLRQVKDDKLANDKWINLQKKLKWDAYMHQTLEDLRENRIPVAHPINYKKEPIGEDLLLNIIKERYKNESDQNDLKTFIELLKEHRNSDSILIRT